MTVNLLKKLSFVTVSTAAIGLSLIGANPAQANSSGFKDENVEPFFYITFVDIETPMQINLMPLDLMPLDLRPLDLILNEDAPEKLTFENQNGEEPEILLEVQSEVTAKVPEPSTLLGLGLFGLFGSAIAKKKRQSSINS